MIDIYLQTFRSFQPTFRFHMPFLTFKARMISAQQIDQSWCLEAYKLFAPAQKQLAHPLFSSYSVYISCAVTLALLKQGLQVRMSRKLSMQLRHTCVVAATVAVF